MKLCDVDYEEFFRNKELDLDLFFKKIEEVFPLVHEVAIRLGFDTINRQEITKLFQTFQYIYRNNVVDGIKGLIQFREPEEFFDENHKEILKYYPVSGKMNPKNYTIWWYIGYKVTLVMELELDNFEVDKGLK